MKKQSRMKEKKEMGLNWKDTAELAEALDKAHPDADLVNLEADDVRKMVGDLPHFEDTAESADDDTVESVIRFWILLENGEDKENAPAFA